MKKFERLSPEQRKMEIRRAAMTLFLQKGFRATTMENIVSRVSLSKGGVYRLYGSTEAILEDLILEGMRLRNAYYAEEIQKLSRKDLTLRKIVTVVADSLLIHEDFSRVYVEFLWEKQRSPRLEALYRHICQVSVEETTELILSCGAEKILLEDESRIGKLTDLMNTAILGIRVLGLDPAEFRDKITDTVLNLLL